ncbi:MAG: hypothetical protein AB1698_01535 [Pseudomonadota bacterium]
MTEYRMRHADPANYEFWDDYVVERKDYTLGLIPSWTYVGSTDRGTMEELRRHAYADVAKRTAKELRRANAGKVILTYTTA